MSDRRLFRTAAHWGVYDAEVADGRVVALHPVAADPNPSPIGRSMANILDHPVRVREPMVRRGWLDHGPEDGGPGDRGRRRGGEPFVPVDWDTALDLVAGELERVRAAHGDASIFAGCYGWASAGCFHRAAHQLHRFMALDGGYTGSLNTYSFGAAEVVLPHVLGDSMWGLFPRSTTYDVIAEHGDLVVAFGGIPLKNAQVQGGSAVNHSDRGWLDRCRAAGVDFVLVSPVAGDLAASLDARWIRPRPNTDTALMLGLAHTLLAEGLHDQGFLDRYCTGFETFRAYLTGETDGIAKDAAWAAGVADVDAETIRSLARRMAAGRTMINVSWSLQRADHGEQAYWMAVTLAAMLGQIGLPGGGIAFGYGAVAGIGNPARRLPKPMLPVGRNPVDQSIPVARIADALLAPGAGYDYDGERRTYPDIRMIYWAGGNPFHHHQDLNRLIDAWQRPETIVVHEQWWTATARHADIVLPVTTTLERNDLTCSGSDTWLTPIKQAVPPTGAARSDHDILASLAARRGIGEAFTEGRDEADWLRHLYDRHRQQISQMGIELPGFDAFWAGDGIERDPAPAPRVLLSEFRADPAAHKLGTPSGKIEIFSETVAGFGYDDCPGHPVWREPGEWLGGAAAARWPLHLVTNQPRTRLHSQYDHGAESQDSKVAGREPIAIHPADAAARGIADGDVVRVFNDRGACLAGATVADTVRPGVVQLATGAWFDPVEPGVAGSLDKAGNPNMLTPDRGTSRLAQACAAESTLVEIERYDGAPPPVTAYGPPPLEPRE